MTNILLSVVEDYFFWQGVWAYVILGIISFLIGLIVAAAAWKNSGAYARRLEQSNAELRKTYDKLKSNQSQIDRVIEEL